MDFGGYLNHTYNTTGTGIKYPRFWDQWVIYAWVSLPCLILGGIGNFIVLTSVVRKAGKRKPLNLVLFSQFFSDFLLSAVVYPTNAVAVISDYVASDFVANVFGWLFLVGQTSSTIAICSVAVNRVAAIIYFVQVDKIMQFKLTITGIAISWLLPISLVTPICFNIVPGIAMYALGGGPYPMGATRPSRSFGDDTSDYLQYLTILDVSCVVIPSIITVVCYCAIWIFIRKRKRRDINTENAEAANINRILTKHIRAAKMSCVIAVLFFVTYYPYMISVTSRHGTSPDRWHRAETNVVAPVSWLFWCGSCVNPLVYVFLSNDFRRWFRGKLGRFCAGNSPNEVKHGNIAGDQDCPITMAAVANNRKSILLSSAFP